VDDELASDYLARVQPFAKSDIDAVFHFVDFIDEATRAPVMRWDFESAALLADPSDYLLRHPMPTHATFLRRSKILEIEGFDEVHRCFEDGDFNLRLAVSGARLACAPATLEFCLRHGSGASANQKYCFQCRLGYLTDYAAKLPSRLHPAVAAEAERAAIMLLRFGDRSEAQRAINLCRQLGRSVPSTLHPVLRALRPFLSAATLLHWQDRWRQHLQSSSS
jgi:hypothetical protein